MSIYLLKVSFSFKYLDLKAKKVKNSIKLKVLVTIFVQFLVKNYIFFKKLHPFQLNTV